MTSVQIAGQTLRLLAERCVIWEDAKTLLIADPHFGKAAAFRAGGIPVPAGTTQQTLTRITRVIEAWQPRRVVFLGDFLHARTGRAPDTLRAIQQWREQHAQVELMLVRGNHDRSAGDPPSELGVACCNAPVLEAPFALLHHPGNVDGYYALAGHIHPGALLSGGARHYERLPCFWFGNGGAVLPAFGEFTGLAMVEPAAGDRVFVVVGDEVVEAGKSLPR